MSDPLEKSRDTAIAGSTSSPIPKAGVGIVGAIRTSTFLNAESKELDWEWQSMD
ncbi:MAG: hypothetical protein J7J03_06205 [Methanosarcinales archaeon]|nr:hypothetical protein [Methanosarcinales archaeon]